MKNLKKFKKITSVLLVLTMIFALAMTAFAAGESETIQSGTNNDTGSITIDNALVGESYSIYQIFKLESYSFNETTKVGSYSYTVADGWEDFFKAEVKGEDGSVTTPAGKGLEWVTIENGYVTWNDDKDTASELQKFAQAALDYAEDNHIEATKTATATASSVTFSDLNLGYYVVTSSVGTVCSLDTTNTSVTIEEKNPESSIEKTAAKKSYNIGDTIPFTLDVNVTKVAVPEGETVDVDGFVNNVVITDTMTDGFTFTQEDLDALAITITRGGETTTLSSGSFTKELDANGFTITFVDGTIKYGDKITVTYNAVLNEKAVIAGDGNTNKAELAYGANQKKDATETVYTGKIVINKFDGETKEKLAGAEFVLTNEAGDKYYKATYVEGTDQATATPKTVTWVEKIEDATHFTTDVNGAAEFKGLAAGTYKLVETKAPNGYNMLSGPVTVTIYSEENKTETVDGEEIIHTVYNTTVDVPNSTGPELPSTGGMGTKLFIAIGSVMLVGAGILLVTKRRMNIAGE